MKFGCSNCFFLNTTNLICRHTDISKCFSGSLRFRDNESRLYVDELIRKEVLPGAWGVEAKYHLFRKLGGTSKYVSGAGTKLLILGSLGAVMEF